MSLYCTLEFRSCLNLFSAPFCRRTCSSQIWEANVELQIGHSKNKPPSFAFSKTRRTYESFTLLFCRRQLRNVQRFITHVHSYCSTNLFNPFVWKCSRCRCRRGLFKVPINVKKDVAQQGFNGLHFHATEELEQTTTETATRAPLNKRVN